MSDETLYVGRIVAIGRSKAGKVAAMYRVSSRSFPNRTSSVGKDFAAIIPLPGHESDIAKNPYIAYNCLRVVGEWAIVSNGSHTDPIAGKIASGMQARDALALSLLSMDFEKDAYNTPRIAGAIHRNEDAGFLAAVRKDGLDVRELQVEPGRALYVTTYERQYVEPAQAGPFDAATAQEAAHFVLFEGDFARMTKPIAAVAALETEKGFEIAAESVKPG